MEKKPINVVWLKRDLRLEDHAPLFSAEQADIPYLIVYIFEPEMIARADCSLRHLQFCFHSVLSLNNRLEPHHQKVFICYGKPLDIFNSLSDKFCIKNVFSHQESGVMQTWGRDKRVAKFFEEKSINWHEFQRDGIIRGISNRSGWDKQWFQYMHKDLIQNSYGKHAAPYWEHNFRLPEDLLMKLRKYLAHFQPPGTDAGRAYMKSFFDKRVENYSKFISKPTESRKSCARLSPYLAWGNLSIRQVYQESLRQKANIKNKFALKNFQSRLRWHCHFIQKFEQDCTYEFDCINKGYELLTYENDNEKLQAWIAGRTGIPIVDACMLCLENTGWINFRMRAMLVSFLCHHLDQDWRRGTEHLASLFLDYEPGIHYPQFQMQAGTTGTNTIRIYNPIKNGYDHDPEGAFVRKWIPQLANFPNEYIHEPWTMPPMEAAKLDFQLGKDYPYPIVDVKKAAAYARVKVWGHRKHPLVKEDAKRILKTLVRKRRARSNS